MKKLVSSILAVAALSLSIGVSFGVSNSFKHTEVLEAKAETVEQYYSSITDSMQGETLRNALNTLNNTKRKKTVGYAGMRQFAATCDADPDGSGKIIGFYDNKKVGPSWDSGKTWNREHVWPNVRGGDAVEDDAHMTRPASTQTNSDRGSKGYGMTSYDPGQFVAYYRGAASRIIFYAAIASLNLNLVDDPLNYHGGTPANSMGSLSEMLAWNLQYLPSDTSFTGDNDLARRTELNRNEKIQTASGGQGNRNPFIDHPEYACKIWGNYNEKTKQICSGQYTPVDSTVTLDKTEITIDEGEKTTLKATSSNGGTITWSTSNTNITLNTTSTASDSSVEVTGVKQGTSKISAINGDGVKAECTVTINKAPEPDPFLTISKTSIELNVGEETTISASSNVSNISWWFSKSGIATISKDVTTSGEEIKITALKAGETTLTCANDLMMMENCTIKVNDSSGGDSSSEPETPPTPSTDDDTPKKTSFLGCGGYIATGSAVIFAASIMGLVFFIRKRKEK